MTLRADMDCYQTLCDEIHEEIGAEPIESKTYMLTERVHTVDDWTSADLDSMIFQSAWRKDSIRIDVSTNRIDQTVTIVLSSLDESKNTFRFE